MERGRTVYRLVSIHVHRRSLHQCLDLAFDRSRIDARVHLVERLDRRQPSVELCEVVSWRSGCCEKGGFGCSGAG